MYDSAEGANSREKINAMRREQYAENKDQINEQKRMRNEDRKAPKFEGKTNLDFARRSG